MMNNPLVTFITDYWFNLDLTNILLGVQYTLVFTWFR